MEALDAQIADLKNQLASVDTKQVSLASDLATFEQLKLEEKFAEQKFTVATMTLEKAKQELRKQRLFLSIVVPPSFPESALFPERGINILLTFTAALVLWGIISLVGASISDHFVA